MLILFSRFIANLNVCNQNTVETVFLLRLTKHNSTFSKICPAKDSIFLLRTGLLRNFSMGETGFLIRQYA